MDYVQSRGARVLAALACCSVACVSILAGCGVTASGGQPGPSGTPVAYDAHAGHILVQLFPSPGFIFPPVNGVPSWTLYGDGTVVFAGGGPIGGGSRSLLSAKLATDQVQHILDVVVRQYNFFASDKGAYGHMIPDTGSTLLTVNAENQSKTVGISGNEGSQPDAQTKNIFAIESFLQGYHLANAQPYAPQGVAVLVYPSSDTSQAAAVRPWPYPTVDLSRVEATECPYLQPGAVCSQHAVGQTGILPIYGTSGTNLLSQLGSEGPVAQNGSTYLVMIWPLMPDVPPPNAHPTSHAAPVIRVASSGQIREWPLLSMSGVPIGA